MKCYAQGKCIIELGAGCGLVGLVFAALGANVLLTDLPNVTVSLCTIMHAFSRILLALVLPLAMCSVW